MASKRGTSSKKSLRKPRLPSFVCKPCWELKYCPYGPLVEYFPLDPDAFGLRRIRRLHREVVAGFAAGHNRTPSEVLEETRRLLWSYPPHWEFIKQYSSAELACSVFGHICPVFFSAEPFTETKEPRRVGRHIPREIMLKVVRRDGQICQRCSTPVQDSEVEFDHLIPISRGGPVSADNLRLLCRKCNRRKRDSLAELLESRAEPG